jgi:hypothetical protein
MNYAKTGRVIFGAIVLAMIARELATATRQQPQPVQAAAEPSKGAIESGQRKVRAMDDTIREEIRFSVRTGFYDADELLTQYCEEIYEPGELDSSEVKQTIARELAALKKEQASWSKETDCDRLTAVMQSFRKKGIS